MLYKTIIKIPMDHYETSTFTSTRSFHDQNLQLPNCRTDIYKYSFFPATIRQWNTLPGEATNSQSLQSFKQLLR